MGTNRCLQLSRAQHLTNAATRVKAQVRALDRIGTGHGPTQGLVSDQIN